MAVHQAEDRATMRELLRRAEPCWTGWDSQRRATGHPSGGSGGRPAHTVAAPGGEERVVEEVVRESLHWALPPVNSRAGDLPPARFPRGHNHPRQGPPGAPTAGPGESRLCRLPGTFPTLNFAPTVLGVTDLTQS